MSSEVEMRAQITPEFFGAISAALRAADEVFKPRLKKVLSARDLKVVFLLLQAEMTRKQIELASGFTRRTVRKAVVNLEGLKVIERGDRSGRAGDRSGRAGDRSGRKIYRVADRDNILFLLGNKLEGALVNEETGPIGAGFPGYLTIFNRIRGDKEENKNSSIRPLPLGFSFTEEDATRLIQWLPPLEELGKRDKPIFTPWKDSPASLVDRETHLARTMFLGYRKDFVDPASRVDLFAEVYWNIREKFKGQANMPTKSDRPDWWADILLARHRADSEGLSYEVFIESIRRRDAGLKNKNPDKYKIPFPSPNRMKSVKAGAAAGNYRDELPETITGLGSLVGESPWPEEEFDPENPDQQLYFCWGWSVLWAARPPQNGYSRVLAEAVLQGQIPEAILEADGLGILGLSAEVGQKAAEIVQKEVERDREDAALEAASPLPAKTPLPACFGKEYDEEAEKCQPCPLAKSENKDDCELAFLKAKRAAAKAADGEATE